MAGGWNAVNLVGKKMKLRFELESLGFTVTQLGSDIPDNSSDNSGNSNSGDNSGNSDLVPFTAEMERVVPSGWASHRYAGPVKELSFTFPTDDEARVRGWFSGNYTGVTRPASETVKKNLTAALHGALESLAADTALAGLFLAPFRIAIGERMSKGIRICSRWVDIFPIEETPEVAVRDYSIVDNSAEIYCEFFGTPVSLRLEIGGDIAGKGLVVVASMPCSFYDKNGVASGTYRQMVDGVMVPFLEYPRYTREELGRVMEAVTDLRVLADIPSGESSVVLTAPVDWKSLEKYVAWSGGSGGTGGSDPSTPSDPSDPGFIWPEGEVEVLTDWISTSAWSMGGRKVDGSRILKAGEGSVRGVALRGRFDTARTRLFLEGSVLRESVRMLARGRGRYLSGLRGCRMRWVRLRVRSRLRAGDFLEALELELG